MKVIETEVFGRNIIKKTVIDAFDMHLSEEVFAELYNKFKEGGRIKKDMIDYLKWKIDDLFRDEKGFKKYVEIFSRLAELKGFALLRAEGEMGKNKQECYRDGKRLKRVQNWINKHDGKYACLFLFISDINGAELESRKSVLVIPDDETGNKIDSIFSPFHGRIDKYTIGYYLEEVKDVSEMSPEEIGVIIDEMEREEVRRANSSM